ncbi:uncharacterized protein [Henckelia pumila]|uniref:uncharacterized protein n=1 Tax=Henckelia pumila TaxID=405737 RepID=UPI003C6DD68B
MAYEMKHGSLFNDPNLDLNEIRRIISNRLSAQRYRFKRGIYTRDLETMVKDLEVEVSILTLQLDIYKKKKELLQLQNDSLRSKLEKRLDESKSIEMDIEENKTGINMFKMEVSKEKEIPYFGFAPLKVIKMEPNSAIEQSSTVIKPTNEVEKTIQDYEDVDRCNDFDAKSSVDAAEREN